MKNDKAIPQGYMTVGEVAKKMGVTVRTLQYYDREGLFSPSAESVGGRRLYEYKDVVKLHQILSLKHLGFSLGDIKNHLTSLDTPAEVADALTEQAAAIREKLDVLTQSLKEIEMLKVEVLQMKTVDFKKYADIIVNLQMKNEYYWLIKHFDDKTLDFIRGRFDMNSGLTMLERFTLLQDEVIQLQEEGVPPESEKGQSLAKAFWDMVMDFTNGNMELLPELMKMGSIDGAGDDRKQKQDTVNSFIGPALDVYLSRLGVNPFEEINSRDSSR